MKSHLLFYFINRKGSNLSIWTDRSKQKTQLLVWLTVYYFKSA